MFNEKVGSTPVEPSTDSHNSVIPDDSFPERCKLDTSDTGVTGTLPDSVSGGRSAIKSYQIIIKNSSDVARSIIYNFNVVSYCNQYDVSRLSYMNRFVAWE